jgi:hypothetical protein
LFCNGIIAEVFKVLVRNPGRLYRPENHGVVEEVVPLSGEVPVYADARGVQGNGRKGAFWAIGDIEQPPYSDGQENNEENPE